MKWISTITVASLFSFAGYSAETDHYTNSTEPLVDAADLVNTRANHYLQKALDNLNAKSKCHLSKDKESALYEELRNYFANHNRGQLVKDILENKDFPLRVIPKNESIYSDWSPEDGFLLGRKGAESSQLGLMPLIKIGDHFIGVDKFEHMFGMGLIYFQSHYIKKRSLTDVLKNGIFREKTVLGGNIAATGVFSYADLSANFNGMRFWNHILQKHDDVLGNQFNIGPYVVCENGQWKPTAKSIDFRNYIDASMDESVNCRKFATKSGLHKSIKAMVTRGFEAGACPNSQTVFESMYSKYNVNIKTDPKGHPISHWILNTKGMGTVDYSGEFKK